MLYERELMAIMVQFGVFNEAEVISGCISRFAKHRRKKHDVKALIIHAVQALRRHMAQYAISFSIVTQHIVIKSLHGVIPYHMRHQAYAASRQMFAISNCNHVILRSELLRLLPTMNHINGCNVWYYR